MTEMADTMKAVLAETTEDGQGRCVVVDQPMPRATGLGEVLIKVHAVGINRLDTMQRKGKAKPPPGASTVLGLEVSGVVAAVGREALDFKVGERVAALVSGGAYAEFCVASAATTLRVPEGMPFTSAAGVPEAFLTAHQLLHTVGKIRRGDTVLLHAGSSGVGTAAVQIAKLAGATVLVTVGSREKLTLCERLGADGGSVRHDEGGWLQGLRQKGLLPTPPGAGAATQPPGFSGGVDLVLDCVGPSYASENLDALSLDGRWVLYSLLSGGALPESVGASMFPRLMAKRVTLQATTLRGRSSDYKAALVGDFAESGCFRGLVAGSNEVVVHCVMRGGLSDAQAAHDLMESNASAGKIILQLCVE